MPSRDPIENDVLRRAQFKCVACHAPFVEVHHITPLSEGGTHTVDNLAVLCQACHAIYGANPAYKEQIKQMRDNRYDVCEKRFSNLNLEFAEQVNAMYDTLQAATPDQPRYQDTFEDIKETILGFMSGTASAVGQASTFEEIIAASGPTGPAVFNPPGQNEFCPKCNRLTSNDGRGHCTVCGTRLI